MHIDKPTVWTIAETLYNGSDGLSKEQAATIEATVQPNNKNIIVVLLNSFGIVGDRADEIATATVNHYCISNGVSVKVPHKYPFTQLKTPDDVFTIPAHDLPTSGVNSLYSHAASCSVKISVKQVGDGYEVRLKKEKNTYEVVTDDTPEPTHANKPKYPWAELREKGCGSFVVPARHVPKSGRVSIYNGARQAGLKVSVTNCDGGLKVGLRQDTIKYPVTIHDDHVPRVKYPWEELTDYNYFFVPAIALATHADPVKSIRSSATNHGLSIIITTTQDGFEVRLKSPTTHYPISPLPLPPLQIGESLVVAEEHFADVMAAAHERNIALDVDEMAAIKLTRCE